MFQQLNKGFLYLNLFFLQSYLVRFQIGPYPTNLQEILIASSAIFFLAKIISEQNIKATLNSLKKHWIILSFAILTLISLLTVAPVSQIDSIRHLKFLFFALLFVFIFTETFKTRENQSEALKIGGYGAVTFGVFCIVYNLSGHNITFDNRLLGPLDAAVYLAYYLTPFFLFFTTRTIDKFKRKDLLAALLLGIMILATRSMGAIGASTLIILFYIFKKSKIAFFKKPIGILILSLILIATSALIFYTKILPTINTNYSSLDERGEIWATAVQLLKEPKNLILGTGLGQFENYYMGKVDSIIGRPPLDYHVLQPHNIFFLFIFNYGFLGLALLLTIIFLNFKKLDKPENFIVLYFLIHGLIDTPFFKNDLMILFILFLEIALINHPKPETSSKRAL